MDEKAVIDRVVDGQVAVLLIGAAEREVILPVGRLPRNAKAGDWLRVRIEGDEIVEMSVDVTETETVQRRIAEKMDLLRKRGAHLKPCGSEPDT